jgi:hypothetical protein
MGVFLLKNSKSFIAFLRVTSGYYFCFRIQVPPCRQLEAVFLQFTATSRYNYYTSYPPEAVIEKPVYVLFWSFG